MNCEVSRIIRTDARVTVVKVTLREKPFTLHRARQGVEQLRLMVAPRSRMDQDQIFRRATVGAVAEIGIAARFNGRGDRPRHVQALEFAHLTAAQAAGGFVKPLRAVILQLRRRRDDRPRARRLAATRPLQNQFAAAVSNQLVNQKTEQRDDDRRNANSVPARNDEIRRALPPRQWSRSRNRNRTKVCRSWRHCFGGRNLLCCWWCWRRR